MHASCHSIQFVVPRALAQASLTRECSCAKESCVCVCMSTSPHLESQRNRQATEIDRAKAGASILSSIETGTKTISSFTSSPPTTCSTIQEPWQPQHPSWWWDRPTTICFATCPVSPSPTRRSMGTARPRAAGARAAISVSCRPACAPRPRWWRAWVETPLGPPSGRHGRRTGWTRRTYTACSLVDRLDIRSLTTL